MRQTSSQRWPARRAAASATAAEVIRARLDNGLQVVLCPRAQLAQTYVALFFGIGSRHEEPALNGVSHMLEHMLFRGTRSFHDATALNAAAEDFGGFLEGATYRDHMLFATVSHPSALAQAVTILSELVQAPRYRSMEIERAILREELIETLDADGRMVDLDNLSHHGVFGRHGLGQPIEGPLENLERFSRRDLEAHRKRHLVGANAVIAVAGPFDPAQALPLVAAGFERLPRGEAPLGDIPPPPRDEPVLRYVRDTSSQVDIRLSFRAPPVQDPDYPASVMLARLLADGLASRMHAELIDRRGLAYLLHAGLTTYADGGLFEFDVAVAPSRAAELVRAILEFAASASRMRFTPDELSRAWRRYRYGMEFMGDSAVELASWYGRAALFGVDDEMAALGARIEAVSAADVRAAARRLFQRRGLVVTAVGELVRGEWRRVREVVDGWGP